MPLLQIQNVKTYFPITKGIFSGTAGLVKAVDDVSFSISKGETVGLVGESGSGKSTLGRTIVNLIPPTSGLIKLDSHDFGRRSSKAEKVQLIFQDPLSSLNPRMKVGNAIAEVLRYHKLVAKDMIWDRVKELFTMVELSPEQISHYPHEFSGGQRQRIGIARALAVEPKLIICDEIVSALDVSVQAQIINLLKQLQKEEGLAYLFITHDLAVVRQIAHKIAVMYCGKIVEFGDVKSVISSPIHPYTKALLSVASGNNIQDNMTPGDIANPANPPNGCHFHPRCPVANKLDDIGQCSMEFPNLDEKTDNHFAACHQI